MSKTQQQQQQGICFPITDKEKNERSTTKLHTQLFSTILKETDTEASQAVSNEKSLRFSYPKYLVKHVEGSLQSKDAALNSAKAGLDFLHDNFEFVRGDKTYTLAEAMKNISGTFETGVIKGEKKVDNIEFEVPYKGKTLKRDALVKQLKRWCDYGTIEEGAREAIEKVATNPKWADLSDTYFVLLGAGSAMGPYIQLMNLGANVIAIDLDRPMIWKRLISIAKDSCGTLTFPLKKPQSECKGDELYENAGSNLITQTPEINNWLANVHPNQKLVVGCYTYLDGEAHVKVSLACDAIMKGMVEKRQATLAYLCTPTDCHVITEESWKAAKKNYESSGWRNLIVAPIRMFSRKMLVKNVQKPVSTQGGDNFYIVDGLVVPQGPNYAVAKRLQHWRAITSREQGSVVSSNVAPSTATASVVHNRQFAWAYDGMPFFVPFEIFEQDTSNAVMAALLINDIRNNGSVSNPSNKLKNPLELFAHNSFHGGVWRAAYTVGSIGEVSVLVHFAKVLRPVLFFILVAVFAYFYQNLF